jgi:hypothetical protein
MEGGTLTERGGVAVFSRIADSMIRGANVTVEQSAYNIGITRYELVHFETEEPHKFQVMKWSPKSERFGTFIAEGEPFDTEEEAWEVAHKLNTPEENAYVKPILVK